MRLELDQSGPVRTGESIDVVRLQHYLTKQWDNPGPEDRPRWTHLGPAPPNTLLQVHQFGQGYSNLTYHLVWGTHEWVLRRPPVGNQVKSAHDMGREYRVLASLCQHYPPAPRPWLYCADPTVLGTEFYLMERRKGIILRGAPLPATFSQQPLFFQQLSERFIDNLAALHSLDHASMGLGDLGKPTGYIERQVEGWRKRLSQATITELPQLESLGGWLAQNRPQQQQVALIHNDYKYDNVMWAASETPHIVAVLDWEMATLGDPWMDVGTTLAYWVEAQDATSLRTSAFGPTMLPGNLTRQQLVERYAARCGDPPIRPLFYYVFGLFKLATIVQQIYARYVRGATQDARFSRLDQTVNALSEAASQAIERDSI